MKRSAGKIFTAFGFTQLVMIMAIGAALFLAYDPWRWGKIREELLEKFPQVDRIDGETLDRWVREAKEAPEKQGPLILDVRSDADFRVSHLPGANHVNIGATAEEMLLLSTPDRRAADLLRPIVIYCAVGFESAELASRLKRGGFSRVQMLEMGIFRWANERRPLVNADGAPVEVTSAGNSLHSGLLDRSKRAPLP